MDMLKMRIAIGDRMFEADGPADIVEKQVNAFMALTVGGNAETLAEEAERKQIEAEANAKPGLELERILEVQETSVCLRTAARSASEALLVLLLGQQRLRNLDMVGATALLAGMRASGYRVHRIDHFLNTHARRNNVAIDGQRRARRYQLTPSGTRAAEGIAQRLIAMAPAPQA